MSDLKARLGVKRKVALTASVALVAGFLVGLTPTVASAGVARSNYTIFQPAGAVSSQARSVIRTSSFAIAEAESGPRVATVASGWVGVRGRLYNSGGAVISTGTPQYNSVSLGPGGLWAAQSGTTTTLGAYYSRSDGAAWTGSAYYWINTSSSPNQNVPG